MRRISSVSEFVSARGNSYEEVRKTYADNRKNMEWIKKVALAEYTYPAYHPEAFIYVDNLFPRAGVEDVVIFKVSHKHMVKIGMGDADGFFSNPTKTLVISGVIPKRDLPPGLSVTSKVSNDEVIVHELLHFAYKQEGYDNISSQMREEFAYGWSLGYMRQKGHTDEETIKNCYLPYLASINMEKALKLLLVRERIRRSVYNNYGPYERKAFQRRYGRRLMDTAKELGMEQGRKLVKVYDKKLREGPVSTEEKQEISRFHFLDIK